jgi:hypothetical protein
MDLGILNCGLWPGLITVAGRVISDPDLGIEVTLGSSGDRDQSRCT